MLIILPFSATDNPLGLPGDYPANAYPDWPEKEPLPSGYIQVTKEEWDRRIAENKDAAAAIIESIRATKQTEETTRLDAFKRLFTDGRAIDQNWATATAAQRLELSRIVFRILWLSRSSLAELVKPDAS